MKCLDEIIIYQNRDSLLVSRQAVFPGIVQLPNGELLAMFSIGQAFDSADHRAYVSRSGDFGQTWGDPVRLQNQNFAPLQHSETFKPLVLADNTLLAAGYVFVRPDALTPIVDPESFNVLPMKNKVSFSSDNGRSWTEPRIIDICGAPLELSGPCIQLSSGRIIGACAPFVLGENDHAGWIIYSDDGGHSWEKLSEFYRSTSGHISPWECRLCEMSPGHIAVLFWAYDNKARLNLPNHIVFSSDGGETFGAAVDTGIQAQASNLMWLDGFKLLTIHAHREAPAGLWVRQVDVSGDTFNVESEINLFASQNMASDSTDIAKQFGSLKFGQPSLLRMDNDQVLAALWCVENCQHVIKSFVLEI